MAKRNLTLTFANPLMKLLLRSPWHGVASNEIMLITVIGRKTGKRYTTPVNYVHDGDVLSVLTHSHRTWWRNLRGGAPVQVRLRGKTIEAMGYAYEDAGDVIDLFRQHLQAVPKYAPHLGVAVDEAGRPIPASVEAAAAGKVMVEIELPEGEE